MENFDDPVRQRSSSPVAAALTPGDTGTPTGGETVGLRSFLGRHERAAFVLLLVVGLMARVVWVSQHGRLAPMICETYHAAVCFARTGGICDDYFPGQGAG